VRRGLAKLKLQTQNKTELTAFGSSVFAFFSLFVKFSFQNPQFFVCSNTLWAKPKPILQGERANTQEENLVCLLFSVCFSLEL